MAQSSLFAQERASIFSNFGLTFLKKLSLRKSIIFLAQLQALNQSREAQQAAIAAQDDGVLAAQPGVVAAQPGAGTVQQDAVAAQQAAQQSRIQSRAQSRMKKVKQKNYLIPLFQKFKNVI